MQKVQKEKCDNIYIALSKLFGIKIPETLTKEQQVEFAQSELDKFLVKKDNYAIFGLDDIADRIVKAIKENTPITIVGDYDVDGVTATSCLQYTLKVLNANPKYRIPQRMKEGFGLSEKIVEEIDEGLIITVDNGIAAHAAIELAKKKGLEVILTDHHLPNGDIPKADYVLDAHLPIDEKYKTDPRYLGKTQYEDYCGAGIAGELSKLIIDKLEVENATKLKSIIDAFETLGTICDVMPLNGDNRNIARRGLKSLITPESRTLGLSCLLKKVYKDEYISATDIGFSIGPMINAIGRLQNKGPSFVIDLLTTDKTIEEEKILSKMTGSFGKSAEDTLLYTVSKFGLFNMEKDSDSEEVDYLISKKEFSKDEVLQFFNKISYNTKSLDASDKKILCNFVINENGLYEIDNNCLVGKIAHCQAAAAKLEAINNERKHLVEIFLEKYTNQIKEKGMQDDKPIMLYEPNVPEGIVGIIAGKVAEMYDVPTLIFTDSENEKILKGSGRTGAEVNLKEMLDLSADEIYKYGGHAEAAGISIEKDKFEIVKETLKKNCHVAPDYVKNTTIPYVMEIDAKDVPKIRAILEKFEPFGQACPALVFKINNFKANGEIQRPGQNGKYLSLNNTTHKIKTFSEYSIYEDHLLDKLKEDLKPLMYKSGYSNEEKFLIMYAISHYTGFDTSRKNELEKFLEELKAPEKFSNCVLTLFKKACESEVKRRSWNFNNYRANEIEDKEKTWTVFGTLSTSAFREDRTPCIDIIAIDDDETIEKNLIKDYEKNIVK